MSPLAYELHRVASRLREQGLERKANPEPVRRVPACGHSMDYRLAHPALSQDERFYGDRVYHWDGGESDRIVASWSL